MNTFGLAPTHQYQWLGIDLIRLSNDANMRISWGASSGYVPLPFQTVIFDLSLKTVMIPTNQLDVSKVTNLDGSVTLELHYL